MKAAIYSRKSKFTGKGESVENQIQLCKDYGTKIGVTEYITYEDEGYSGKNTLRPNFQHMMKDAKAKKFDVLICYRLDRISRNVGDFARLIEELQKYNISFVSIRDQFDTATPMGRAMMYIASVFAQLERETIAERVRDNMLELSKTGRWLGGIPPTGFVSEPIDYYNESMQKKKMYKLSPLKVELDLVEFLFKKYLSLSSLTKLESYCLSNNIKTKNHKDFNCTSLKFILTNPVYVVADDLFYHYCIDNNMIVASDEKEFNGKKGIMVFNKRNVRSNGNNVYIKDTNEWIVAIAKHNGIVTSSDWIKVQNLIKQNKEKAPREGTSKHALLSPILRCANCGSRMRVISKYENGKFKRHYYKCVLKSRSNGSRCNIKNLNGLQAEEDIIKNLKKIPLNQDYLHEALQLKKSKIKTDEKEVNYQKSDLVKKTKSLEQLIGNLTIQLSQNINSSASNYIIYQIEKLDCELKETQKQLLLMDETKKSNYIETINLELLEEKLLIFNEKFDDMSFEEKKSLLHNIIKEIIWDGKTLKVELNN